MITAKVSDRDVVRILTAEAFVYDLINIVIIRSSISRCRKRLRRKIAEKIFEEFTELNLSSMTVHKDGKIIKNIASMEHIDRLPVIENCGPFEQLIEISSITSGNRQHHVDVI